MNAKDGMVSPYLPIYNVRVNSQKGDYRLRQWLPENSVELRLAAEKEFGHHQPRSPRILALLGSEGGCYGNAVLIVAASCPVGGERKRAE